MKRHAVYVEFTIDPSLEVPTPDDARELLKKHLNPLIEAGVIAHFHVIGIKEVLEWD